MTYPRSLSLLLLLACAAGFALSEWRVASWDALLPVFEWMETTWFGVIGKTWGAAFAVVQAFHLLGMALLGGAVLVTDGRLLGWFLRDQPLAVVLEPAHRVFVAGLVLTVLTGVFMACAVAIKIYYLPVYWYKMMALAVGVGLVFFVKRPLLRAQADNPAPGVLRLVAVASLMVWFSVAATGRWIGFSG